MSGDREVILALAAEGGSITVLRRNEAPHFELIVSDGMHESDAPAVSRSFAASFKDVLEILDRYPWPRLALVMANGDLGEAFKSQARLRLRGSAAAARHLAKWLTS
jgi:hypothetical protein